MTPRVWCQTCEAMWFKGEPHECRALGLAPGRLSWKPKKRKARK
jgi:hypothetical protein